jgi:methylamine dehydrogenase accessory protein MauD
MLIIRSILALVFTVAGLAKLADPAGSRKSMTDFGLPALLASPFWILLPLAELAVAVALLTRGGAWAGAIGASALLLAFIAGISVTLARGKRPDCHCFGQIHSTPIGWKTLTRNAVLALAALFVVWQGRENPGPSIGAWIASLEAQEKWIFFGVSAVVVVIGVLAGLVISLMRQNGRIMMRLDAVEQHIAAHHGAAAEEEAPPPGLPVGEKAPEFSLTSLDGKDATLADILAPGKPAMLMFIGPSCNPCDLLLPEVAGWQREHADKLTIALLSEGGHAENKAKKKQHGLKRIMIQKDREVAEAYQANGTPAAVIVNPDGTIGSYVALGSDQIKAALLQAVLPPPAKVGDPAPPIDMPGLNGKPVNIEKFRGQETVVLFWNPGCGFCQEILEYIKAWELEKGADAPQLLVVSTGEVKENKEQGFRSPVVIDKDYVIGRVYGSAGTPSALLVDARGNIASEIAVGAEAVFQLAGIKRIQAVA